MNSKALVKLSAVLLYCFFYFNTPAYAVGDYNDWTWNNDVDYYKTSIDDSGVYEGSTLTDWHWMIAGDPNNGDTTDDGFCFMYDGGSYGGTPFAVYNAIQPSQCAFYNNANYQNIEWYSFTDLNMIAEPSTAPIAIYQDQQAYVGVVDDETNIFGNGSEYWSGCFATGDGATWASNQNGGGECPIMNNDSNQINWGYMQQSLTQISAIDSALKNAGLETYGYTYSWMVKNADANFEDTNGTEGQDTLVVTLAVKDNGGNIVYKKEFDYSYWIDTWVTFTGDENFDTPFDLSKLDSVMLEVTGQDVGNWDGYYGPEFNEPNVKLKFRPIIEDNTEQLLFEQMCANDALYDINCPGYQTAMMDQMNEAIGIENVAAQDDTQLTQALDAGTGNFDNNMDAFGQETIPQGTADVAATEQETGVPDPVAEAAGTPDPVAEAAGTPEAVAEPTPEAVAETKPEAVAEATQESSTAASESKKSTGLNATQLATLDAAQSVSASAEASASGSAIASAGVGLDENGGVSSTLTSVDPTGSTDATGQLSTAIGGIDMTFATGSTDATQQAFGNSNSGQATENFGNPGNNGQLAAFGGVDDATGTTVDISTGSDIDIAGSTTFGQNSNTGQNNTGATIDNMNTGDMQFDQTASMGQDSTGAEADEQFAADQTAQSMEDSLAQESVFDNDNAFTPGDVVDEIVMAMTNNMIQQAVVAAEEVVEESAEASYEEQNAQEDNLVAAAQSGDDSEEAQAALLGYNPNFRAYQQDQMPGGDIYNDQGVYENQKTYDNPNGRLFNGASDALHREMVRQQYELGN
jgi:hypothetical protein